VNLTLASIVLSSFIAGVGFGSIFTAVMMVRAIHKKMALQGMKLNEP